MAEAPARSTSAANRRDRANVTRTAATRGDEDGTGGATARTPELHRQSSAMEIERSNPTLPPLPTNADQGLPTRAVPKCVVLPKTPDSPKELIN